MGDKGSVDKILLLLHTTGGEITTACYLVDLIRQYCKELQIIVPYKAHSAGTLMVLGANSIMMTKQATLGPIDPTILNDLNPPNPRVKDTVCPMSVQSVEAFFDFAKNQLLISDDNALANILINISNKIHPVVLGEGYRSQSLIRMLAEKLIIHQVSDPAKIKQIVSFLCHESGSHYYKIARKEAKEVLGLNILKPINMQMYHLIWKIYTDIKQEIGLGIPFHTTAILHKNENYSIKGILVESITAGSHYYFRQGTVQEDQNYLISPLNLLLTFEGWRHDKPATN